jgi:hypothetical protein
MSPFELFVLSFVYGTVHLLVYSVSAQSVKIILILIQYIIKIQHGFSISSGNFVLSSCGSDTIVGVFRCQPSCKLATEGASLIK